MAVAQSNAILVTDSALPAMAKRIAPAASNDSGTSPFAALLTEATSNAAAKTGKPSASDKKSQVAGAGADTNSALKTQGSDSQSTADQTTGNPAKDASAVLTAAISASPYSATIAANDSDASSSSDDSDSGSASGDAGKTAAKPAAAQPAPDQTALAQQQPPQAQTPDPQTQAAQTQAAQAQAMLAAAPATPAPASQTQPVPRDGAVAATDSSKNSSSGKTVRNTPATPRMPAASDQAPTDPVSADAAAANTGNASDAANAQTPIAAAQDNIKAAGHQNDKPADDGKANTQPDVAPVAAAAAPPAQAAPASQPASAGANLSSVTAPAAATNATAATNLHIAPQAAAPHMPAPTLDGMAVDIAARSQSGAREFQIRLDPSELGHVDVRLSIDATGKTEAHLTADQPQTLQLLQKDSDTLTRALRDAGLDVAQGSLNFSLKGQDRQGGDSATPRTPSLALAATKTIDAAQSSSLASANTYLSGDARLDIHV